MCVKSKFFKLFTKKSALIQCYKLIAKIQFLDYQDSLWIVRPVFGLSGQFLDCPDSFWIMWIVSGLSVQFLDCLDSFWTVWTRYERIIWYLNFGLNTIRIVEAGYQCLYSYSYLKPSSIHRRIQVISQNKYIGWNFLNTIHILEICTGCLCLYFPPFSKVSSKHLYLYLYLIIFLI